MWGMVYDRLGSYRPAFLLMPMVIIVDAGMIIGIMTHYGTHDKSIVPMCATTHRKMSQGMKKRE